MTCVAVIQMLSSDNVAENLRAASEWVYRAADQGAKLVALPENFALMGRHQSDVLKIAETAGDGMIQSFLADLAKQAGVWLVGGTLPMRSSEPDRVYSACTLWNDLGQCVARYHKIHLYDVDLPEKGEAYRESKTFMAGDALVVADTPCGRLGLSVCYDLRFPELYRALQIQGAELIVVPSAFTATTGAAHWHVLLRARAIENLCAVLAPDQGGTHVNGRSTYGHSLIISPWGEILAEAEPGPGMILADLDRTKQAEMRRTFPVLQHARLQSIREDHL